MESLDFDNGEATDLTIRIMPEQMERLQHFADKARVSLARFMREVAELLAAEMVQDEREETGSYLGDSLARQVH